MGLNLKVKTDGKMNDSIENILAKTASVLSTEDIAVLMAHFAELNAAYKELEAFTHAVAHDLRHPVSIVAGRLEDIMREEGIPAKVLESLRTTCVIVKSMAELIEKLMQLSDVKASPLNREYLNLSDMTQQTATELYWNELARAELIVEQGVTAMGDKTLIRTVLQNLLGNAIKYTGRTTEPKIEFGALIIDGRNVCYVRDNGVGFNMAMAHKLFLPFERLHEGHGFDGYGIGLYTVKRIIERHGGRIWAESTPDKGATFYFTLEPS